MRKLKSLLLMLGFVSFFLLACAGNSDADNAEEGKLNVTTSIYPVYEIVREVAGDQANVSLMVGENEDVHHYEPSAQAIAGLNETDVFIYSSEIMEFWVESVLSVNENENLKVVELSEGLDLSVQLEESDHDHDHDHESEHDTTDLPQDVEIAGVSAHYHTGDLLELTASHTSGEDHWHWFKRASDTEEWEVISGQLSAALSDVEAFNGQVKAVLYNHDLEAIAESAPVDVVIDDHEHGHSHAHEEEEHDHAEEESHDHDDDSHEDDDHAHDHSEADDHSHEELSQDVEITGVSDHYHTGDLIELTASHTSGEDHWHWFSRLSDSEEWEVVDGQLTSVLTGVASENGQQIKAVLYDHDHQAIAESAPVTIVIDDHEGEHDDESGADTLDPHFWLDPVAVQEILPLIVEALSEADAEGAEIFQENADEFAEKLNELDAAYQEAFDDATNRSFVVQHQAFGHLANRYNLQQVSVGGMLSEIEPNAQSLIDVVKFVSENNIPVVYYQSGQSSKTAETISGETDTEVAVLYDLETQPQEDFTENMYIETMYFNLEQLKKSVN